MKNAFYLLLSILFIGFYSCNSVNSENKKNRKPINPKIKALLEKTGFLKAPHFYSFEDDFYSVVKLKPLSDELFELFSIKKIEEDCEYKGKIWLRYQINLSDNFRTLIFATYDGAIGKNILVNYTNDFKLIDFKQIAFEDYIEGYYSERTQIEKNKIIIYKDEKKKDKTIFKINTDGKINSLKNKENSVTTTKKNTIPKITIINPTGTYILDSETEKRNGETYGYSGKIQVKQLSKNRIVIDFSINKGAPSYNFGEFVDTLRYLKNKAIYRGLDYTPGCKIIFEFSEKGITVTEENLNACGFGHGVYAGGFFKKASSTRRRIESNENIYTEEVEKEANEEEAIPEKYRGLFDIKLVGLALESKGKQKRFYVSFSAACNCEISSILIKRKEKKIYLFPYCNTQPEIGKYGNIEYKLKSVHYIGDKLVVSGINKSSQEVKFIFGKLRYRNVFSLETDGERPTGIGLEQFITNKEKAFDVCECGDYQG